MIKIFRWLLGYVNFCFKNGFAEGFLNDCYHKNLNIKNVKRSDAVLYGQMAYKNYKLLDCIAQKNGGEITIISCHGPVFYLQKIKGRWGLFAGALCFIFIINFLSGFVWDINISGSSKITDSQISKVLADNGFKIGSHWSSVNKENVENYILSAFSQCAWVHINRQGTVANVEITDAVEKPDVVDNDTSICNVKSAKDGIIVKATVYSGWQVAKVGDSVTQGDLLVSGVFESESTKQNLFAHARADYIAQVNEKCTITVQRNQTYKNYLTPKKYKTFLFFNLKLPLYIGSSKQSSPNCDTEQSTKYLKVLGKVLPIGVNTKTVTCYTTYTKTLTDSQLTQLAKQEIQNKLKTDFAHVEILSQNSNIMLNANYAIAHIELKCLENIGKTVNLSKKE